MSGNFLEIPCKVLGFSRLFSHIQKTSSEIVDLKIDFSNEANKHVFFWEHIGVNYYDIYNLPNTLSYRPSDSVFLVIDDSYEGLLTQDNLEEIDSLFLEKSISYCVVSSNYKLRGKKVLHFNYNLVYSKFDGTDIQNDEVLYNVKPRQKKFLCLNRQTRFHRIETVDFLLKNQLENDSYISLSKDDIDTASQKKEEISQEILHMYKNNSVLDMNIIDRQIDKQSYERLIAKLPLDLDIGTWQQFTKDWKHLPNPKKFFDDSYWSLITERDFYSDVYLGYTEKVVKAFFYRHPFIVIGLPYTLDILRNMGFMTFSSVIDESYDQEEDHEKRKKLIYNEIKKLCKLNHTEHFNLYHSIKGILDYNRQHLINLNANSKPTSLLSRLSEWYFYVS